MQKNFIHAMRHGPGVKLEYDEATGKFQTRQNLPAVETQHDTEAANVPADQPYPQPGYQIAEKTKGHTGKIILPETEVEMNGATTEQIEQEARRLLALSTLERAKFILYIGRWGALAGAVTVAYIAFAAIRGVGKFIHFISEALAVVFGYAIYLVGGMVGVAAVFTVVRAAIKSGRTDTEMPTHTPDKQPTKTGGQSGNVSVLIVNGSPGTDGQNIINNI